MSVPKAKENLWKVFSRYIRLRDAVAWQSEHPEYNGEPGAACVTCRRFFVIKALQAGHFIPGRHQSILFDERNVAAQCLRCNVHLKGNWVSYRRYMLERYGEEVIAELEYLDTQSRKFTVPELEAMQEHYSAEVKRLEALV